MICQNANSMTLRQFLIWKMYCVFLLAFPSYGLPVSYSNCESCIYKWYQLAEGTMSMGGFS